MAEKKTRPIVDGRPVPVTVLADVLMDEAHKVARLRKLDLADKAAAKQITDEVLAGKIGGSLGKAFAAWLKGDATIEQKAAWPRTFRTYMVKYHRIGGVPNVAEKRAKLSADPKSADRLQAAVEKGAKKAAAPATKAKKATPKRTAAKKARS